MSQITASTLNPWALPRVQSNEKNLIPQPAQSSRIQALEEDMLALQEDLLEAQERERHYKHTIDGLLNLVDTLIAESLRGRVVSE